MREKTYHLYLNEEERSRVIQSLIELKNNLAAQGRYTDAVDDVRCRQIIISGKDFSLCTNGAYRTFHTGIDNGFPLITAFSALPPDVFPRLCIYFIKESVVEMQARSFMEYEDK